MMSFFTSGFFGRRTKRRLSTDDAEQGKEKSYPKSENKKAAKPKTSVSVPLESPFAGATPATTTGSWILCRDIDGTPYWWNDVTGQWSYQLYSTSSAYMTHQQQQLMPPAATLMYPPQQYIAHQPWLGSPSGAHQQSPWSPVLIGPGGAVGSLYGHESPTEQPASAPKKEEAKPKGTWDRYYDRVGRNVWIHSATRESTYEDPN